MKRVLLVVWGFDRFGGMERHVSQLAVGLKRAGVDVIVLSETPVPRSNAYARQLRGAGVRLLDAPWSVWVANGLHISTHLPITDRQRLIHGGGLLSRQLRHRLGGLIDRGEADVIHIHGCRLGQTWLLEWARSRDIPCVYTEHVAITDNGGPLVPEGPRLALAADALACVSDHSRRGLEALLAEPRAIVVTGHGVAAPAVAPARVVASDRFEILCPARLEPYKGVDVLLHALALLVPRHPGIRLTVAGDGQLGRQLRKLASDLRVQGSVTFAGSLSPAGMEDAMHAADSVVLPSRTEGLPLALIEAMACGKPLVVTRAGGMPEIIRDGENGMLVPIEDASAIARALGALAGDADLRARLGAAARRTFEQSGHNEGRVIPQMLELYRRAESRC